MRAHILQHVAFEGPGSIAPWLRQNNYTITTTRFFENSQLPPTESIDFLIIMGGPMSVNDVLEYPWLTMETDFIRRFITSGRPVLGICLGSQLIANALGARILPNAVKEIGWHPVQGLPNIGNVFAFPDKTNVFHWHGETFTLPPGAVRIASSSACRNQAFQIGSNVIGLQFHLETTPAAAHTIVNHCRHELVTGPYIQNEQEILSVPTQYYTNIHTLMDNLLTYLHQTSTVH